MLYKADFQTHMIHTKPTLELNFSKYVFGWEAQLKKNGKNKSYIFSVKTLRFAILGNIPMHYYTELRVQQKQ